MSNYSKPTPMDVEPVNQKDSDFAFDGKNDTVKYDTSDSVNDHAWTINQDTPDTPAGVKSDSTPV
jgi:hypothetical protein